jgi:hypothetical protein
MTHRTFNDPHGTSLEARQGLLDNRCEKGPKRHRTLGRRRRLSKAKRQRIKHRNAMRMRDIQNYIAQVRAYWRGETENHPQGP